MLRSFACIFILMILNFAPTRASFAAAVKCLDPTQRQTQSPGFCSRAGLTGEIEPGDSELLEVFLRKFQTAPVVYLNSPGGDFFEGLRIGRVLRRHITRVRASDIAAIDDPQSRHCGVEGTPVCCASACALAYFGGAAWALKDRLGLHRATARELSGRSYADVKSTIKDTAAIVSNYFDEMDIDKRVVNVMMSAAPDDINVLSVSSLRPAQSRSNSYTIYPASIYDWISVKCQNDADESSHDSCLFDAFGNAQSDLHYNPQEPAPEKISPLELEDEIHLIRKEFVASGINPTTIAEVPPPYFLSWRGSYQIDRLNTLRFTQESENISSMDACQASSYLKHHRGKGGYPLLGEGKTFGAIIERLTKLTGVEDYMDQRNQLPKGCTE